MGSQRFRAVIAAGPRDGAVITMPFDPDEAWGAKADHPVSGTIGGCRVRTRLVLAGSGWVLTLAPKRLLSMGIAIGDDVTVELTPEGPKCGDIAAALAANRRSARTVQDSAPVCPVCPVRPSVRRQSISFATRVWVTKQARNASPG